MMQGGGAFLLEEAGTVSIFIPENLSMEQKELAKTVHDFVVDEVLTVEDRIEKLEPGLMPGLMKKAADLGILMVEIPTEYGGLGLGKLESAAIVEGSTLQGSFNVTLMAHTGIATAPLVFYGNEKQKKKYLPKLASGEFIAAFALTEPEAGSDVMAVKTHAKLTPDKKHYILNGRKQFITNGGFAGLVTVFANLEGKGLTAFLVECSSKGFSVGREEQKMGIHGSSTVPLVFEDVKVPVENLLGVAGKGHHIAFNVLNLGRLKLGAACAGVGRHLINLTYNYVKERQQFGQPLIAFQMIQEKLAMMVSRILLLESLTFRLADLFDRTISEAKEKGDSKVMEAALREYSIEASIAKVFGSEALCYVADDAMQLHGGYGYIEEYGIERYYRDARINRIYEGTNEINRLVITGTLLKLAAKGKLDILSALSNVKEDITELITKVDVTSKTSQVFAFVEVLKKLILSIGAQAVQKYGSDIQAEEYIISDLADMTMELYAIESAYNRAKQLNDDKKESRSKTMYDAIHYYTMIVASDVLDKGRRMLMRILPPDSKDLESYTKAMFGVLNFIRGDQQKDAISIIENLDRSAGYPFS
jgi:alkylation response protein AidB-like acyl-CoA dehydrogenase